MLIPFNTFFKNKFYFANRLKFIFFNFSFLAFMILLNNESFKLFVLKNSFKFDLVNFFFLNSFYGSLVFGNHHNIGLFNTKILLAFTNNFGDLVNFVNNSFMNIDVVSLLYKNYFLILTDLHVFLNVKRLFDLKLLYYHFFGLIFSWLYCCLLFVEISFNNLIYVTI